jgi:FkbM family methyltransferase
MLEYADWRLQNILGRRVPERRLHGVRLGDLNGFSEYHSVGAGLSDDEIAFLAGCALPDGSLVDVGANLGLFSVVLARLHPDRRIFAFEPNPPTCAALRANVARNRAHNVECVELGVAAHDGEVAFAARAARANASISVEGADTIRVPVTRLDSFLATRQAGPVALLKIDVEGYETLVLCGAEALLSKAPPAVVYFEVCPGLTRAAGFAPEDASKLLAAHGYRLHRLGRAGALVPATPNEAAAVARIENWVATRRA